MSSMSLCSDIAKEKMLKVILGKNEYVALFKAEKGEWRKCQRNADHRSRRERRENALHLGRQRPSVTWQSSLHGG